MDYKLKVQMAINDVKRTALMMFKVELDGFDVKYDLTTQNALGMIKYRKGTVTMRLNRLLLEEDAKLYIDEVVKHELAHIIIHKRFPSGYNLLKRVMPHGREFKAVCKALGTQGKSTTRAFANSEALRSAPSTTVKRNKKVHYYECRCGIPRELSTVRHNKVQRGTASYSCGRCATTLSYIKSA